MKKTRILLSAMVACVLSTDTFGHTLEGGALGREGNLLNYRYYSGAEINLSIKNDRRITPDMSRLPDISRLINYVTRNGKVTVLVSDIKIEPKYDFYPREIYGAYSTRYVSNNSVEIKGAGTYNAIIYGGVSVNSIARNNSVIASGKVNMRSAYGGYSADADAINNKVVLSDGANFTDRIIGGYTRTGTAEGNYVEITDSTANEVYGGYSPNDGIVKNNKVKIINSTIKKDIYGGYLWNDSKSKKKYGI